VSDGILIAGGYGVVGVWIAGRIAYPGRLIVSGRSLARANEAAARIGHGAGDGGFTLRRIGRHQLHRSTGSQAALGGTSAGN
jgi:hypothetical protein